MAEARQYIDLILSNRIFSALSPLEAAALFKAGQVTSFPAGATLFRQGDAADALYLVLTGSFGVYGETLDGDRAAELLATIGSGETIGEMGLVRAGPRSATVTALEAGSVWTLGSRVFEALLRGGDPIGASILKGIGRDLCRRFRQMVEEGRRIQLRQEGSQSLLDTLGWEL